MKQQLVVLLGGWCLGALLGCNAGGPTQVADRFVAQAALTEEEPPQGPCGEDGICDLGETPETCPLDCDSPGDPCGNGLCEPFETRQSCPADCGAGPIGGTCGNGYCEALESPLSCPTDCDSPVGDSCGDGLCESHESHQACPADCDG